MTTTTPTSIGRPVARPHLDGYERALVALEILLAIGAWGGAWGLIGGAIDASTYVDELPFTSPTLGGVALGLIVALPATVAAIAGLSHRSWARLLHPASGALLMGWIVVQVAFIGFASPLQPVMFVWGAAILVLGLLHLRSTARR